MFEEEKKRGRATVKETLVDLQKREPIFIAYFTLEDIKEAPGEQELSFGELRFEKMKGVFGFDAMGFLPGGLTQQMPKLLERLEKKIRSKMLP